MKQYVNRIIIHSLTIVVLIAVAVAASKAWLASSQQIVTGSEIITPHTLYITAGNKESMAFIDIGNIDVETNGVTSYKVPFGVMGNPSFNYKIQLAHTTNIAFEYTVYKSTHHADHDEEADKNDNCVEYVSPTSGLSYYYTVGEKLMDKNDYLTVETEYSYSNSLTKGDEYQNVHSMAYAKYMQKLVTQSTLGAFTHFYILEITWTEGIKNDKETDVIYITVEFS